MLAVQVVRDVGHLGPAALTVACKAVHKSKTKRRQLTESCQRMASLQSDFLTTFSSHSPLILAPRYVL